MRTRALLVASVLVVGPVLAASTPAGAISKHIAHCYEEQGEAFHHLVDKEGKSEADAAEELDTCEESPNPILPATNEIIWGGLAFLVVFGLLWKMAIPAIQKGLKAREDKIRDDLEAAEKAKADAQTELAEYRAQLADARNEAARIIEEARQAADAMRREVQDSAEQEASKARERAQSEIEQTVTRARADLQREMGDFAVRLAERIVERNLDRSAQQALIDQYIAEVGALRGGNGNGGPSGN
ncbi:MAG TPA: F0F1 ATP synthase subunit B [Acidimicrobiia bacterium]|nr:F0F1 ATP synthase subunit B [Acidimicrobiia bacterium]